MAGEQGATEQRVKPVKELAREFILTLPSEGLIFHGTLNKRIGVIRKYGLKPKKQAFGGGSLHFFSFNPSDSATDNLSSGTIKDTLQQFRNAIKENVFWAGIHASLHDMDIEHIVEDDLPAIVVAKKPIDSKPAEYQEPSEFPHDYSYNQIPPENILAIASLTSDEYKNVIKKIKANKARGALNEEVGKILSRKILRSLIEKAKQIPVENKPQVETFVNQP